MSLSKPPKLPGPDSPIAFMVAIAGHHYACPHPWYRVTALNGSDITPSYISTEVNRQHQESCPCPWRGSREFIYAYQMDLSDKFARDDLREMSHINPPAFNALLYSAEDWPVPAQYTAKLSASGPYAQFVICNEANDALKRKASSSLGGEINPITKQTKVANNLPVVVKEFPRARIILVGNEATAPKGCNLVPKDLQEAFCSTKIRTVVVDQTTIISRAFTIAGETVGWGFYVSSDSREDLYFVRSSLMAFLDMHPEYAEAFQRTFGSFFVSDWLRKNPSFTLYSRSFILHFQFGEVTPLGKSIEKFEEIVEEAVYDGVKAAAKKYKRIAGMASLCDIIEGCTGREALKRVLEHVHELRKCSGSDTEIAIMVDGYDNAARLAHSEDIIANTPRTHVSLEAVTSCFKSCFYSVLANALDSVTTKPVIQRLILFGVSPAFTETLSLSLTIEDLSHLSGVSGLHRVQIMAQVAWIYGTDNVDDPHVKKAMLLLQESCPFYSYSSIHGDTMYHHVPRRYLKVFFSLITKNPDATSQDLRKALGSKTSGAFSRLPPSIFNTICTLYGRAVLFWGHDAASDLLNQTLEVPLEMGVRRLRFSYSSIPMDTISADNSYREVTEITPLHFAEYLVEEGLFSWRLVQQHARCYFMFPTASVHSKFNRQIVERSLLKTHRVPAQYREPAVLWIRDVLSAHLVNRPFSSVVYLTENVPQTAVDLISEVALPRSGALYGRSFMEVRTQIWNRIDNAMLVFKAGTPRPQLYLWEFKNIPIPDLYEATMCRPLPRTPQGKLKYAAHPILEKFMETLDEIAASEWNDTKCPNPKDWPKVPATRGSAFRPRKLQDLFYVGYDDKGERKRYSIFHSMYSSDGQVHRYGAEAARHGHPQGKGARLVVNDRPNVGGLDDPRLKALPASKEIKDKIMLGTVTVVAGRFVIARDVGSEPTGREFRPRNQR
ncbi:hypothetical protein BDZ89DRAFT_1114824 [Hymenopellis radicata]|nr:hypothetical protein BDZ89DRAFT_1114824 [Hymenopellis radicata]